jgi:acetylcholinesterase
MLWLQGGAFVQLFNPNYNGTGLIEASNGGVIVVSFNYRVGAYGFLASEELRAEGNLNIGIHDQRFAMAWVQKHISKFGGDPNKVTLFGTSVGGGSVLLQTVAYGGNPPAEEKALWTTGIAGAVYMPSVYEVSDLEFEYEAILNATNCTDLSCLRSLDSIQAANIGRAFPGQESIPLFSYGPVIDGAVFTDHPQAMLQAGNFSRDKTLIIGSSSSEGTIFAPQANTSQDVASFLRTQYPALTDLDLTQALALYRSVASTYPGVTVEEAPFYFQAAQMYGDLAFSCPALEFARELSAGGVPVHLFRNNIVDPVELAAGYIVPHTWEVPAVWGPEYESDYVVLPGADSYDVGGVNHAMVDVVQKYWTSFVITNGNPNTLRGSASPLWPLYSNNSRLKLQTNATAVEDITQVELERCEFWRGIASRTRI